MRHFLLLYLILGLEFALVYFGADMLTTHRTTRLHLYLQSELAIPLFPPLVLAYLSIYLIWLPAPFILRGRAELDSLAVALATVILVAGCGFLALPATLGFAGIDVELSRLDPTSLERWGRLLQFASLMSLKFNLVPSLHVAFFVATAGVYMHYTGRTARAILGIWAATVATSTLLTHQHHLIDVVTGVILGIGGACLANQFVFPRLQHREHLVTVARIARHGSS